VPRQEEHEADREEEVNGAADCTPPNRFSRKGNDAVIAGDIVMPVDAASGRRLDPVMVNAL
jgi:hypothetical protein